MTALPTRIAFGAVAALTLAGSLAACSTGAQTAPGTDGTTGSDSDTTGSSGSPYADGTYEASGSYQSPNGTESVDVTLTLEDDIVTAVEVVGNGGSPDSKRYQGQFIDGIADEVVGRDIDDLDVDRVAGSSLTSGGFNAALDTIKAEALA